MTTITDHEFATEVKRALHPYTNHWSYELAGIVGVSVVTIQNWEREYLLPHKSLRGPIMKLVQQVKRRKGKYE